MPATSPARSSTSTVASSLTEPASGVGVPSQRRPRVALIHPYWDFWESSVDYDLRQEKDQVSFEVKELLDVEWTSSDAAECVLVLQTMATPPSWTLDELPDLPVVVWAAHRHRWRSDEYGIDAITAEGATVGGPMLTSVLVRAGRPFELIVGQMQDWQTTDKVMGALTGAAAATRIRSARIARLGPIVDGYACVDTPDDRLAEALGIEVVRLEASEFAAAFAQVGQQQVDLARVEAAEDFRIEVDGQGLDRSLRAACALDLIVERYQLSAGAINCHVPEIRFGDVGVTPCFALGRSTTKGIPWSCTGDVLTAAAMLISKSIGGSAQYHELETYDYEADEFVIASSGEHDLAFAGEAAASLVPNRWFAADPCVGACACFSASAGSATLLALADIGDHYRLIEAAGELTGSAFPETGTANAGFRFNRGLDSWRRWCEFGANHHSSATRNAPPGAARACAKFLALEYAEA
jgi:L-arabinose isomerase